MTEPTTWRAPVCFDARSTARLVRDALTASKLGYEATTSERPMQTMMLVLALPKTTLVHRFRVAGASEFTIDCYDTKPTPGALIPYLEVRGIDAENEATVRRVLQHVAQHAPRSPWKFTFGQRLASGLALPEYRKAKHAWQAVTGDASRADSSG